ncbi:MAG: efflux RND transporter periplasmic adaptor subunit [bacterium]|nr:efflux RND transporter periplasmic adaptor subunit [bacterium]
MVAVLVILIVIFTSGGDKNISFVEVKRGTISQEVNVTGKTVPNSDVKLGFERSGKIAKVNVSVGDKVAANQTLATIDSSELYAQLLQAQAELESEEARYNELKKGTRSEELAIYETELNNAQTSLNDAKTNLVEKINDTYTKADNAIHNDIDIIFSNPRTANPKINFIVADPQLRTDVENMRLATESNLIDWKNYNSKLKISANLSQAVINSSSYLNQVKNFLDKLASAVNSSSNETYKTNVSLARSEISSALSILNSANQSLNSTESAFALAAKNLNLKKSGSTSEGLSSAEAQVKRANASVKLIQSQLNKAVLRSPIAGTVTKIDAKKGEIAQAGTPLINIISDSSLEIESFIPEVDVAKISLANTVKITFDALGEEGFLGKVIYIDPAETVVDGVANFKVKIALEKAEPRLKSGLTVNLTIQTLTKENVLILPQFAVLENDKGTFVKKYKKVLPLNAKVSADDKNLEEVEIKTGIYSGDGNVEIISGLNAGDAVATIGLKTN